MNGMHGRVPISFHFVRTHRHSISLTIQYGGAHKGKEWKSSTHSFSLFLADHSRSTPLTCDRARRRKMNERKSLYFPFLGF